MWRSVQRLTAALVIVFLVPYVIVTLGSKEEQEAYALQRASENFISIHTRDGIREIGFEDYVCGVAARELGENCGVEAAKAQMVVVRTNLKKFQEDNPGTLLSEEYMTLEDMEEKGILEEMLRAVEETNGQVLTFENKLIRVPFHAVSSGRTRSGEDAGLAAEYPWLTAVESRQDVESEWYLSVTLLEPEALRTCIDEGLSLIHI